MFGLSTIKLAMIAGAVLLLSALAYKAYSSVKESGRAEVRAEWALATIEGAEKARKTVAEAQEKARKENEQAEQERYANEQAEREAQQNRAEQDQKKIKDLDRRYRDALLHNASCAKQDAEIVACPLN